MLSPLDDYPIHQIAEPVRHVATSDRNFYDRYYFNAHSCSDEVFLVFGMGQYPNLGVADAFVLVVSDGVQRVVRASRVLGVDRMDTTVGPFRVDVLEGLRRLRVTLDPNDWGVDLDLVWQGAIAAHQEPRHFRREHGRVTFDTARLAQTGRWSGHVNVDGRRLEVSPDRWWGSRDRSWGVRPVGEPEPPGIKAADGIGTFFWIYAPMQFDDFSILAIVHEEADGTRLLEQGVRVPAIDSGAAPDDLGSPSHELTFTAGTRMVERATLSFAAGDRGVLSVDVEPPLPVHVGIGTGYGFDADWRHGMYQGPLVVQGVRYDLTDPEVQRTMFGLVDSVARFTVDGEVGYGLFEWAFFGPHQRYGWKAFDDA